MRSEQKIEDLRRTDNYQLEIWLKRFLSVFAAITLIGIGLIFFGQLRANQMWRDMLMTTIIDNADTIVIVVLSVFGISVGLRR